MDFVLNLSAEEMIVLSNIFVSNIVKNDYNAVQLAEIAAFFKLITVNLDAHVAKEAFVEYIQTSSVNARNADVNAANSQF